MFRLLLAIAIAATMAACGGGGMTDREITKLLIDQGVECYAVAAGRLPPDRFNAAAAGIASMAQATVCAAWPPGMSIACADAYALYSRPFAGKCL